jgi:N-terminal acetyltransferase B complex catalytic subunit
MNYLERVSEDYRGFFVDLFVRASNAVAIEMYRKLGYDIYRTVNKYYSSSLDHTGEDAYGITPSTQI